ncbi:DotD/TraH family lipoprotein [Belnapia rosea]|uniref:DotD/TraH family lipoprotein n=1 Tax=Belnapia rosea TaxID=938405 RepID=UPI000B835931|nr:DotD/TraH family lipoprotein [Belnapia rosea]
MTVRPFSLAAAGLLIALAGCANHPSDRYDVDAEATASPEVALLRSFGRVDRAMAAMRATARPGQVAPSELQKPIVWRWSGPMDQAAKALADRIGWSYAAPGPDAPAMPTVTVDANGTTVLDVFRSIGTQAGNRATLLVDPDRRIVQVQRHV